VQLKITDCDIFFGSAGSKRGFTATPVRIVNNHAGRENSEGAAPHAVRYLPARSR